MILMEFLFALTVPSEPRPKKTARTVSGDSVEKERSQGSELPETSSTIPTVKWFFGRSLPSSAKTPATIAGVNSFEDSP